MAAVSVPARTRTVAPLAPALPGVDRIGAMARGQYSGDGLAVVRTKDGARLRSAFQKLNGDATRGGLWVTSTASGEQGRLRLVADAIGRDAASTRLAGSGVVEVHNDVVAFTRPGLVEEYATNVDGVRQDFVIADRPAGAGKLHVDLALTGAKAEGATGGAKLTLDGSGRELAYDRLRVKDASGRALEATLDVSDADHLAIRVDDEGAAYPVRIDPTFSDANWVALNPGLPGVISNVDAIAIDGNGTVYVGGPFFGVAGAAAASRVAKWDGSAWSALGSGMNDRVIALSVVGTDLYAGGWFTTAGGVSASRIAKWNGSAWSALGSGMNGNVLALAASGGTLYAGGEFTTAGGVSANRIAQWNGSSWSALGSGMNDAVNALAVSGTTLYAAGNFLTAGGLSANLIAKWDTSGIGGWSALGSGLRNASNGFLNKAWSIAVSGADVYVGGDFDTAGGASANRIAKWNTTTNMWSTLGTGLSNSVFSVAVIGSNVYVAGAFQVAGSASANFVAQWNGSAWSALGPNGTGTDNTTNVLAVSGTDLYLGGSFNKVATISAKNIAKWNGSAWSALGTGIGGQQVNAIALSGTNLYIGGTFLGLGGMPYNQVLKWNGSAWSALGTGVSGNTVTALALVGTDLYAAGSFGAAGGVSANFIAKWNGTAWSALGTGMDNQVNALAVSGTTLYAGGFFTTAGGTPANRVAKWNGTAWSALGTGLDSTVRALAFIGTDLYAAGDFSTAGGGSAARVAKWNGTAWSALGSGMNNQVWTLAVSGTDLYAGGTFTTAGGVTANRVAKWSGNAWSALGSGIGNATVIAVAASGTDLYVGGDFPSAGGVGSTKAIAKWDGSAWSPMGSGIDGNVRALLPDTSGHLFVGGNFGMAGTTPSAFIARADVGGNTAPIANAGSNQTVEATSAAGAGVTIDGTASSDPNGDTLTYTWKQGTTTLGTAAALAVTAPFGSTTYTLTVSDGTLTSSDDVVITVQDTVGPSITITSPTPSASYTQFQAVAAAYSCADVPSGASTCAGPVANGANIDTATGGTKTFAVNATDGRGNASSQSFTYNVVAPTPQTITFTQPANVTYGVGTMTLTATATSGLAVTFSSNSPSVCTVSGTTATILSAGTCSITASQSGNTQYAAATPVTQTFSVLTKPISATLTANSKVYDGTTSEPNASLSCALSGVLASDSANVVCMPSAGSFDSANVGSPRTVTATLTLSGSATANYTFGVAGTASLSAFAVNAPTSTTAAEVYGQAGSFTTTTANNGGISATSLSSPRGVAADASGNIYVADITNNRVLFFPFGQTTATRVYGQGGSYTTNAAGLSATSFSTPNRVTVDSTGLYVSDAGNNRVLYFPNSSSTPTRVYGQGGSFTSSTFNASGVNADSLGSTRGMAVDAAGDLYIVDAGNHRVLFYPPGSTTATRVYGQNGSFTTGLLNNTGGVANVVSADSLNSPNGIRLDTAGNLYVVDQSNHRVLMYPAGQTTATRVYGQGGSFTTGAVNGGGSVSAASFNTPANLALDGGNNLYVADSNNNRVLFFPSGQTTATAVYGQAGSFTTNLSNNTGGVANTVSASSLRAPNSVDLDFAGNIYVSDASNNRVLRFTGSAPAITPAPLAVTASSGTKAYGATFTVTPSYSGLVNGETTSELSPAATCTSAGAAAAAAAGSYATTCSGAAAANYSIGYVAGTLTVTSISATPTLSAADKTYDGTTTEPDANLTCTLSGMSPADASNVTCAATGGTFDSKDAGARTVTATIALGGSAAPNYTLASSTAAATASITQKGVTASITADSKTYDGTATASIHPVVSGVIAPDAVTVNGSGTFDTKDAGVGKTVTSNDLVLAGTDAANYSLGSTTATAAANITAKNVTATITADDKTYDRTTAATIHPSVAGVIAPDVVTVSGTGTFDTKDVGAGKTVTSSDLVLGGADAANYALSASTATAPAAILGKTLTATITADDKTYDRLTSATIHPVVSGVIAPDVVTASGTGTFDSRTAGVGKTVTSTDLTLGGAEAGNYALSATPAATTATITPKSVTATITADNKTYDTTVAATIHPVLAGVIAPDAVTVSGTGTFDSATAGSGKPVTSSDLALGGADAGNYSLSASTAAATAEIAKTALGVTVNDKTRFSYRPDPVFDGTLTGVLGTDGITATYSTTAIFTSPVGMYPITPALVDPNGKAGNYTVTLTPGTLTITNTAPTITVPADVTVEATSAAGAVVAFTATGNDAEDGTLTPGCSPASEATFAIGTTTVTCTVTDSGQVSISGSFVVTVGDTTKPMVTVSDITKTATDPAGIAVTYVPAVTDAVTADVAPVCSPTSGSTFTIGTHTVNCSATDAAGNSTTVTFTVTVLDGVKPVVTVPADRVVEATSSGGAVVSFTTSASDNLDETLTTACTPASGALFALGTTLVTCTAADAAGNLGSASFTVTVRDTTPPALTLPTVVTVTATSGTGAAVIYAATAVDVVDGAVTPLCTPASGTTFPIGSTTVTCTATDAHGNSATGTFAAKVNDGVAPLVMVSPAGNRLVEAASGAGAVVTFTATASDNYDSALTVTCTPASGSTFPITTTTVTCTAKDGSGNLGSTSFDVTVRDTTAPVLTLPAPITVTTALAAGTAVTFPATASDLVDGSRPVTCVPASGSTFPVGVTTVSCTASDTRGNTSTATFAVTVVKSDNAIGKFVAFSRDETWLRSRATVMIGDVGANERRLHPHARNEDDGDRDDVTVRIGEGVEMKQAGSTVVGNTILTQAKSSVYNVLGNALIASRTGIIRGAVNSPIAIPYLTLPAFPTVTPGTTKIEVARNQTLTLPAGSYNSVHVSNGATLILTGGLYQMLSLDVDQQGTVLFRAATEIRIKTELDVAAKSKLILDQTVSGLRASQMVIYVDGDDSVCGHRDGDDDGDNAGGTSAHIGQNSVVQANIYVAKGTLWLKSKTQATGAFIGLHVRIGQNSTLTLDSAFR